MSRSQGLTLALIRRVFGLLGEVRDLGDSPSDWRRHMLLGLIKLVDADLGHAGEAPIPCSPTRPRFCGVEIEGVADKRRLEIYNWLIHVRDHTDDPCAPTVSKLITRSFTRTRQQLAEDGRWYRRADADRWRSLGADCFVYSHLFLGHRGFIHLISINRAWGRRPFDERERRVVGLLHSELGRLWRQPSLDAGEMLPRRHLQTLQLLLQGQCEKHIANRLDLSRHTVHSYIKALYRKFNVSGQPELMARLYRERRTRAPRTSSGAAIAEPEE